MKTYNDFQTLLEDLKNNITIKNGLILENSEKYNITRKINNKWELISLSQYKNSEDLILVETEELAFTISRWDEAFTLGQQISINTK